MIQLNKSIISTTKMYFSNNKHNYTNIGYGIDNNFVRCMATSITSICKNNPHRNFIFHIIGADLTYDSKQKINTLAKQLNTNIIIYEINVSYFKKLPTNIYSPVSTYFRFILPFVLPNINKLFYIDADVICVNNADIFFDMPLDNNIIAAVPDSDWANTAQNKLLKLYNHTYFNAGILIIDIEKWNKFKTFEKSITHLLNSPKNFPYFDQDALNLVLTGKIKYISNYFNFTDIANITKENISNIIFVHYSAHPKPWFVSWSICKRANSTNINLYNDFEKITPWANTPLIKPRNYKEMEHYSKALRLHKKYFKSLYYYLKYVYYKIKTLYL